MTVGDLIKKLQKVDQKKKVQIVGQLDGNLAREDGTAISLNTVGKVKEYNDYVALGRVL